MVNDRAVEAARRLMELGVSQVMVVELLVNYSLESIENQLDWLSYRKASRPAALLIKAIRSNYSAPKEVYASYQTQAPLTPHPVDQDPEHPHRPAAPGP